MTFLTLLTLLLLTHLTTALTLPPPTGQHSVGTVQFPLTDHTRLDPTTRPRRIMLHIHYPSLPTNSPPAPYFGPLTAAFLAAATNESVSAFNISTNSHTNATILPTHLPVVFFDHGLGAYSALYTTLIEELASYGFVVVAIDHPYDAGIVEFPDGLVFLDPSVNNATKEELEAMMETRVEDMVFALDELQRGLWRRVPGADCARMRKVGVCGHSFGGAAAGNVMLADGRFLGGVNMDGTVYGDVVRKGLDRPFVLMGSEEGGLAADETWRELWGRLRGWRRAVVVKGAGHRTFEDVGVLAELAGGRLGDEAGVGSIEPLRGMEIVRVWVRVFFEMVLKGAGAGLYDGGSAEWPEVEFEG